MNFNSISTPLEDANEDEYRMTREDFRLREQTLVNSVAMSEAAVRLYSNPDFKKVIVDLYLTVEPARLAGMYASDNITEANHKHVSNDIMGIGKLKLFLSQLSQTGAHAQNDLDELRGYTGEHGFAGDPAN